MENAAGEPLPDGVDLLGLGLRALGFAASLGAAAITGVIWAVQSLHPAAPDAAGAAFYLLVLGTPAAMVLAGLAAWFVLRPVESWFRRGGLSIVSAFLAFVLSLATLPANALFGRIGLATATTVFVAAAAVFAAGLRRWGRPR